MSRRRKLSKKTSQKIFYKGANQTNAKNLTKDRMMKGGFHF